MSNILKGILNETSPHDYDSDWDYQDAVARSGRSRSGYRSSEDDTFDADVAYSRKMYQLGQQQKAARKKAQRDSDHDRLATGTNEEDNNQPRTRMNDYYDLADAIQDKLRQAIQIGNKELIQKYSKDRDELDARITKYGLMPESQLDEISNEKLGQYKTAASADASKADKEGDYKRGDKRFSGIVKATKKQFANDTKKSGISQGINEFSPGATGPKGPKDYGQPNSSRYIGKDKFVVGTTNNYVLTATVDKWGLEWDEDDEIWFLDSPGAAHIADASEGEIELPPPREQRNQIHDLVTDYLNARNSADLQKVAAYYGHSNDGEMATNESSEAPKFNSKQEVINHFVKNGKSAAAGAAAWERGYRGSSPKRPIELRNPPQRSYHDDLDDKRYSATFENLGDQLTSNSLDALVKAKLAIERQREADIEAWKQDFQKNTVQKAQQQLGKTFQPIPVAQSGEKHSVLKDRLKQLNIAEPMLKKISKLITAIKKEYPLVAKKMDEIDEQLLQQVLTGPDPRDNYQSLISSLKKLDVSLPNQYPKAKLKQNPAPTPSAYSQQKGGVIFTDQNKGVTEAHDERDEYDNPRQGRDYGKGNLFVDPGSTKFPKEKNPSDPDVGRGRPKNLKGVSKGLPADAFGRTTGKIPTGKPGKVYSKMSNTDEVDEGWSQKYKSSINCSHPKGFSQKAHCAGKKKHNESIDNVMEMTCPDCGMCEIHVDHENLDEACWKGYHKEGNKKMFGKTYPNCVKNKKSNEDIEEDNSRVARKPGQPANSKKHSDLYTDENPKGTITGLKFSTAEDARASVSKIRNSGRSHAHKIQAAVAMEQRAKAAGKSEAASVYRKYINATKKTDEGIDLEEACWDTHKQVGMKNKGGKQVPNCVPKESVEGVAEEQHSCPHCGGEMVSEELMNEKKDACYYKVKSRYKVWPSAYASGALVKCRKKGADSWGNGGKKNESSILEGIEQADESLHDWFNKEKWVRMDTKGKIKGPCAREPGEGKPKCLPQSKAHSLGKKGRASAAQRKRREDPNPERSGKAINVDTKKSKG